jgi:hypothetical protein
MRRDLLPGRSSPHAGRSGRDLHPVRPGRAQGLDRRLRKKARTVDFDYFQNRRLKWTEDPGNPVFRFKYAHFLVETSDFDRPTIRVAVPSRSDSVAWNAKLSILMP